MLHNRYITIELELDNGKYFQDNNNVKTIVCNSGFGNATADIQVNIQGSGYTDIRSRIVLYGLAWDDILKYLVAQFTNIYNLAIHKVRVYAGNYLINADRPTLLIEGQVVIASIICDNPQQSSRSLEIEAYQGGSSKNQTAEPTIINSPTAQSLEFLFLSILQKNRYGQKTPHFNKVKGKFKGVHLEGSWEEQLARACVKFGYQWRIKGSDVYIAPIGEPLVDTGHIPIISDEINKFHFPRGIAYGLSVDTYFDEKLLFGQVVELQTVIDRWQGMYTIVGMDIYISNNLDRWYNVLTLTKYT